MIGGYTILLWIGLMTIIVPFLGIQSIWKDTILFILGITLVGQYLFMRYQEKIYLKMKKENKKSI